MGLRTRLLNLDARGSSILPLSTDTSLVFLRRLSGASRGPLGPALAALAREVLQQRSRIDDLEKRLAASESRQGG